MSALTVKGQVTIPKRVRDHLGLRAGDDVRFVIEEDRVFVEPHPREHRSFYGMLRQQKRRHLSIDDLESSVLDAVAADDRRVRVSR